MDKKREPIYSVSVIVPIYNVEKWLFRCLESIRKQKFKDFKVILVNDGSTDDSENICSSFVKKDARFFYYKKNNGGLSDARNYGLKYANTKYVVFVDSDDYLNDNYLLELYNNISLSHSEVAVCEYNLVDENQNIISIQKLNEPLVINLLSGRNFVRYIYDKNGVVNIVVWNKIYLTELFKKIKFEKGRYFEDEYLFLPLFWKVKQVSLVRKSLYNYVQRQGSITTSSFSLKKFYDIDNLKIKRMNFLKEKDKLLYRLSIRNYKDWIVDISSTEWIKTQPRLEVYLQQKYRKLITIKSCFGIKDFFKDLICFCNINFFTKIKK